MCGFVAVLPHRDATVDPESLGKMTAALVHRGPDAQGLHVSAKGGLGFRRLSILDLAESGNQPMASADGKHVLVFNGEIYNYVELREELRALGHQFRSTGDSEVLLSAYREWGSACVERLNGMWAFLILDTVSGKVFGARDRFGVKPLYYHRTPERTIFASEVKAIRDSGLIEPRVNWSVVSRWLLADRLDVDTSTFIAGISSVPAGSAFEIDPDGSMRLWRYWRIPSREEVDDSEAPRAFAELFEDAVRLRLRSDVPVGVLLSGGLDSTAIICAMARQMRGDAAAAPLNAFCFMAPEYDETPYIEATLGETGARLHRLEIRPDELWRDVEVHLSYQDEPVHSPTSVIGFKLMQLAREHDVKVLLNGQGADEVLGGYPSYFVDYWSALIAKGRFSEALREKRRYGEVHGDESASALFAKAVRRVGRHVVHRVPGYDSLGRRHRRVQARRHSWYRGAVVESACLDADDYPLSLTAQLRESVERAPLPLYLRVEDRNSMAHSVEVRLPFLDYRLVSLSFLYTPFCRRSPR